MMIVFVIIVYERSARAHMDTHMQSFTHLQTHTYKC